MKKFLAVLFLFSFNLVNADIVEKLIVNGNKKISSETIKVYGDIKLNTDYSRVDLDRVLKNLYDTNFFEDVSIDLKNKTLNILVKEYPVIYSIEIKGEKAKKIKEAIFERLSLKEKNSYIESSLNSDVNIIKRLYSSIGFNFAEVTPKIEKLSGNRLNLVFIVNKNNKTKISKINFVGDKKIKSKRLFDIIVSQEHKPWKFLSKNVNLSQANTNLDTRLLANYYKSIGYYDVQVLSSSAQISSDNYTTLTFNINAGQRYKINKISTNINEVLDKKLFSPLSKEFKKAAGEYYSPFKVKKLLDAVDYIIAINDLQFIEHSVNEVLSDSSIEVVINIYEGAKQTVERINVNGNNVTNETVIRSQLLLDEGDPFSLVKLDKSIAKLKSRNIFGAVQYRVEDSSSSDLKIINIDVEEKPTGEISAGAGIGTDGGSVAFSVSENNWLGKGIKVETFVDVNKSTFKGGVTVNDPNFNFSGNSLEYYLTNTTNDKKDSGFKNNIIASGLATTFEQYRDLYVSTGLNLAVDTLKVSDSASTALKKQKGTFTDLMFNYGASSDKRDRAFKATNGYVISFSQGLPVYADSPYITNNFGFSKYLPLSEKLTGSIKYSVSAVNGIDDDVRISKRQFASSKRLRGFKRGKVGPKDGEDHVGGNYKSTLNFETTLPNLLPESTKTDVGLFLDFGSVWGVDYDKKIEDSSVIRSSTGAMVNWLSPIGPMSFVLAQTINKASTDQTESFTFNLGTTF